MADKPALTEEDRANLVAYLDGELQGPAAKALEAKLQNDPQARAEAEALRRTWQLLDYLPRPEPSPNFTHRTLERVTALQPTFRRPYGKARRLLLVVAWAAAVVGTACAGFAGARWFSSRPAPPAAEPVHVDQDLVQDLRLVENLSLYKEVDNYLFLKALADPNDPDMFGNDQSDW